MPDLRKILFGTKDQNYIDITHPRAPSRRKAPLFSRLALRLRRKKKPLTARLKTAKKKTKKCLKPVRPIKHSLKPVKLVKAVPRLKKRDLGVSLPPQAQIELLAGEVTHFFDKIQVCVLKVKNPLKVGDILHFQGSATDFIQEISSMQIDHQQVVAAKKGDEIGLKVKNPVRVGDQVFLARK